MNNTQDFFKEFKNFLTKYNVKIGACKDNTLYLQVRGQTVHKFSSTITAESVNPEHAVPAEDWMEKIVYCQTICPVCNEVHETDCIVTNIICNCGASLRKEQ